MFSPCSTWISPLGVNHHRGARGAPRFRAKPGAKYTYRYSTDLWEPEWGIVPTQKGRLIRLRDGRCSVGIGRGIGLG